MRARRRCTSSIADFSLMFGTSTACVAIAARSNRRRRCSGRRAVLPRCFYLNRKHPHGEQLGIGGMHVRAPGHGWRANLRRKGPACSPGRALSTVKLVATCPLGRDTSIFSSRDLAAPGISHRLPGRSRRRATARHPRPAGRLLASPNHSAPVFGGGDLFGQFVERVVLEVVECCRAEGDLVRVHRGGVGLATERIWSFSLRRACTCGRSNSDKEPLCETGTDHSRISSYETKL